MEAWNYTRQNVAGVSAAWGKTEGVERGDRR